MDETQFSSLPENIREPLSQFVNSGGFLALKFVFIALTIFFIIHIVYLILKLGAVKEKKEKEKKEN